MPVPINSQAAKMAIMAQAIAAGGPYHGVSVGLIAAPINPTDQTHYADITQPTYAGYATVAVAAWLGPFVGGDGNIHVDGGDVLFQMTDSATPTTVYGWFLYTPAVVGPPAVPAKLELVQMFSAPVLLVTPDNGVVCDIDVPYGV